MKMQEIVVKNKFLSVLLLLLVLSTSCNEIKTGKATYRFTLKVSEEFMQKEKEKAEGMSGGDNELFEGVMKYITKVNSERIYSLFFQENKTVFSMDTEWFGQDDPNKIYIDYQTKQIVLPREEGIIKESLSAIEWNSTEESKKIGKWDVQKATAEFDGQVITAWFSKHPTLRITPREYVGLEGIVVELELESGSKYTLTNFESDESVKVDLP